MRNLWGKFPDFGRRAWLPGITLGLASLTGALMLAQQGGDRLITSAAVALAAILSSIGGFAFGPICGALLFHVSPDRVHVMQIILICSIANQAAMTWAVRHSIQWRLLGISMIGGTAGLPIGVWLLLHADRTVYTAGLGVLLLALAGIRLFRKPVVMAHQPAAIDVAAGLLGGVAGGAAGFPSVFITIWNGMKGWDKTRQRGVCQPFILLMQVAALLVISLGAATHGTQGLDAGDLLFIPGSLLGTAIGLALYRRLSDLQFACAVNVLMIASGVSYVL